MRYLESSEGVFKEREVKDVPRRGDLITVQIEKIPRMISSLENHFIYWD